LTGEPAAAAARAAALRSSGAPVSASVPDASRTLGARRRGRCRASCRTPAAAGRAPPGVAERGWSGRHRGGRRHPGDHLPRRCARIRRQAQAVARRPVRNVRDELRRGLTYAQIVTNKLLLCDRVI